MTTLTKDGKIMLDGEMVGHIDWNENVIVDMMVDRDFRNQGVGTEAVSQVLDIMRENGHNIVKTTAVVSGSAETVLRKNGFVKSTIPIQEESDEILAMSQNERDIRWFKEL